MLAQAQALGFLGPGPVGPQLDHARAFQDLLGAPRRALDLGSGGGLPGLVLAATGSGTDWVLLDAGRRRARFLEEAVARLSLTGSVAVICRRAEDLGRDPLHRERYDAVVARSFAAPPVTAECAAPLLRLGGLLVVSEPPGGTVGRWPEEALSVLGLVPERTLAQPALASFRKTTSTPQRYPRRVGTPAKRPLWKGFT